MNDLRNSDGPGAGHEVTRPERRAITPERLADVWPQVATRLERMLFVRGVDRSQCDDVVQEVAARALAVRLPFDSADDLYAWAAPVARNLHVDLLRASGRLADGEGLLGVAAPTDVEHEVERRIVLQKALRALAKLGEADRAAILDTGASPRGDREAGRVAVRRHRARQRLRLMIEGALGWTALVRLGRRTARTSAVPVAATGLLLGPALFVAVLPGAIPQAPTDRLTHTAEPVVSRPVEAPAATRAGDAGPTARPAPQEVAAVAPKTMRRPAEEPDLWFSPDGSDDTGVGIDQRPNNNHRLLCHRGWPVGNRCLMGKLVPPIERDPGPPPGLDEVTR